jgi:hypothetical protein
MNDQLRSHHARIRSRHHTNARIINGTIEANMHAWPIALAWHTGLPVRLTARHAMWWSAAAAVITHAFTPAHGFEGIAPDGNN